MKSSWLERSAHSWLLVHFLLRPQLVVASARPQAVSTELSTLPSLTNDNNNGDHNAMQHKQTVLSLGPASVVLLPVTNTLQIAQRFISFFFHALSIGLERLLRLPASQTRAAQIRAHKHTHGPFLFANGMQQVLLAVALKLDACIVLFADRVHQLLYVVVLVNLKPLQHSMSTHQIPAHNLRAKERLDVRVVKHGERAVFQQLHAIRWIT